MTKQLRNLIIAGGTVAVLAIAFVVMLNLPALKGSSSSSESTDSTTAISLFKTSDSNVTRVDVTNGKGGFSLVAGKNTTFYVAGLPKSVVDTSNTLSAVEVADAITATKLIKKNASDLSVYGLKNPKAVIRVSSKKGGYTLNVGDATPTGDGYYVCKAGTEDVYVSSGDFSTYFLVDKSYYVTTSLITVNTDSDLPYITDITFAGSKRSVLRIKTLVTTTASSTSSGSATKSVSGYQIVSPVKMDGDSENIQTMFNDIASLSGTNVIKAEPSRAQLESYGLLDPWYTFSYTYKGKPVTLQFGKTYTSGGTSYVYVMLKGRNVVYNIDSSSVSFRKDTLSSVASRLLLTPNIDTVKTITFAKGSSSWTFALSGTGTKLKVTYNGKNIKTDNFRNYYQNVIGLETEGLASKPSGKKAEITITFNYRKAGKAPSVLTYYPIDAVKSFVALDGKGSFYVLNGNLDQLVADTKACAAGKTVSTN